MLPVIASLLMLAADGQARAQQFGAWQSAELCASGLDSFGCTRTLEQSNPNLDVILIFRADFVMRATIRNCDHATTRDSFLPDSKEWKRLTLAARMDRARQVLMQWAGVSGAGCDHPPALSFDGFENGFAQLDAASPDKAKSTK